MNAYLVASTILAISLYVPLSIKIWRRQAEQALSTWILWGIMDAVLAGSIIAQHGNFLLPLAYAVGSVVVICAIIKAESARKWGLIDNATFVAVALCIFAWVYLGPKYATIIGTLAMGVASVPQLIKAWREPHTLPKGVYIGYGITNALSTLGGKAWTVEDRLYPGLATIFSLFLVGIAMRKR